MFVLVEDTAVSIGIHRPDKLHTYSFIEYTLSWRRSNSQPWWLQDLIVYVNENPATTTSRLWHPLLKSGIFARKLPSQVRYMVVNFAHVERTCTLPPFIYAKTVWAVMYMCVRGRVWAVIYMCVRGRAWPVCICVLGVEYERLYICVRGRVWLVMYMCVRGRVWSVIYMC